MPSKNYRLCNPAGKLIYVPNWVIRQLRQWHMLRWNRPNRCWQITNLIWELYPLLANKDYRPMLPKAVNPAASNGRPLDSGNPNRLLQILGKDLSGLNAPPQDEIDNLKFQLRPHGSLQVDNDIPKIDVNAIVREIKAKRIYR